MVLLLSFNRPGRLDPTRGNDTRVPRGSPLSPASSISTPRRINSLTEHPRIAALDLSWR